MLQVPPPGAGNQVDHGPARDRRHGAGLREDGQHRHGPFQGRRGGTWRHGSSPQQCPMLRCTPPSLRPCTLLTASVHPASSLQNTWQLRQKLPKILSHHKLQN